MIKITVEESSHILFEESSNNVDRSYNEDFDEEFAETKVDEDN